MGNVVLRDKNGLIIILKIFQLFRIDLNVQFANPFQTVASEYILNICNLDLCTCQLHHWVSILLPAATKSVNVPIVFSDEICRIIYS